MLFTLPALKAAASAVPWGLVLKGTILAAVFVVGLRAGCSWQGSRDAAKIAAVEKKLEAAAVVHGADLAQIGVLTSQIETINAGTARQKAAADARIEAAEREAKLAADNAKAAQKRAAKVQGELDKAKRDPDCKRLLESPSCAVIR